MGDKMTEIFGEPIYTYSRAQALEDGEQVDVSQVAREAGIRFPVFMNRAVWACYVEVPRGLSPSDCDERGRLHDILWMLRANIIASHDGDRIKFDLLCRTREGNRRVTLKAMCGPLDVDKPEPAITIMLPEED